MRWVVVGSSGYIGSALCRDLIADGRTVLSVSRQPRGPEGASHQQIKHYSAEAFRDVFAPGDHVIYAAGLSSARDCKRWPDLADMLNCQLPTQLLAAAQRAQAESFLYLSSVKALTPLDNRIAGEFDGAPATDAYGNSKWRAERALLAAPTTLRVNVLRPAAVYGVWSGDRSGDRSRDRSGDNDESVGGQAPAKAKRAFAWRQRFRVWGRLCPRVPATGYRSFVALEDVLSAIRLVVESRCDREVFIAAEPQYCDLGMIASMASGRRIKNSRFLAAVFLAPARVLSVLGVKTGLLDVTRSELYSSARLKSALSWRPVRRYAQFLHGGDGGD